MGRRKKVLTKVKVTKNRRIYRVVTVTKQVMQCERPYVLFGEAVRARRAVIEMTQQELADALGFSRGSIANIETGRQRVALGDLIPFAEHLKCEPLHLFREAMK